MELRLIHSDNGTLTDITYSIENYFSGSKSITINAAEDAIYIGSAYPLTSKYFKFSSVNAVSSSLTVSYWDGTTWQSMSDVIDETDTGSTTFGQSGYINFQTDSRYSWIGENTIENNTTKITGLGDVRIYELYWIKLTFSGAISFTIDWVGELLCSEDELTGTVPGVGKSTFMTNWETGKTNWEEQRYLASVEVLDELRSYRIPSGNILLRKSELSRATVYKTLELIYSAMGDGFEERVDKYSKLSKKFTQNSLTRDGNLDGRQQTSEINIKTTTMVR